MRKLAVLLLLGLSLGCSSGKDSEDGARDAGQKDGSPETHPQETYTNPGCANEDYTCPRLKTVFCALDSLRAEHDTCEQDSDCVAADVDGRCTGQGECPPYMVNAAGRADFETKANSETLRYCTGSPVCTSSGSCGFPSFVARCKQGRCVAEPGDAGT